MMDCPNVGMTQRCKNLRLELKSSHALGIAGKRFRNDFDGNLTGRKTGVAGTVHFSHSANTEEFDDFVGPDLCARFESHRVGTDYTFAFSVDPTVCCFVGDQKAIYFALEIFVTATGLDQELLAQGNGLLQRVLKDSPNGLELC